MPLRDPVDPLVLSARLSARMVHDLAGAAQGLANAVSLAQSSAESEERDEALRLAAEVSDELSARLAFCRAAYAGAGVGPDLQGLLRGAHPRRAGLVVVGDDRAAPEPLRRLALLLGQICGAAVAGGGETCVRFEPADGVWSLRVGARGPRSRPDAGALDALRGDRPGGGPGLWALGALSRALVAQLGGEMSVETDPLGISVRLAGD